MIPAIKYARMLISASFPDRTSAAMEASNEYYAALREEVDWLRQVICMSRFDACIVCREEFVKACGRKMSNIEREMRVLKRESGGRSAAAAVTAR